MISRYAHISFDLDGTLVHTRPEYRHEIVPLVLAELGGRAEPEAIDAFWFETHRTQTIRDRFGVPPDVFWERFNTYDTAEARSGQTFAYADAIPTIRALKAMGKTVSVITGAPSWIADMEIAKLADADIDHLVAIWGSAFAQKPSPDSMHHVLRHLGHQPHETIYIGNGIEDALFAEAAGCGFIRIDRGEHVFHDEGGHRLISSLDELFKP